MDVFACVNLWRTEIKFGGIFQYYSPPFKLIRSVCLSSVCFVCLCVSVCEFGGLRTTCGNWLSACIRCVWGSSPCCRAWQVQLSHLPGSLSLLHTGLPWEPRPCRFGSPDYAESPGASLSLLSLGFEACTPTLGVLYGCWGPLCLYGWRSAVGDELRLSA